MRTHLGLDYYDFFIELSSNNHKTWFDENRKRYETAVKIPFLELVESFIQKMSEFDSEYGNLEAKKCVFRINKDIRFSKDKSPYKTHCAASFHIGGKMKMWPGGMYLHLGPEECGVYTGVYMPEKDDLATFRMNIANNLDGFQKAISQYNFKKYFGEVLGEKNKIIDKSLQAAAKIQPLIYNKQFYVAHNFEPELTLNADFLDYCIEVWRSAVDFNRVLSGNR